MFKTTKWDGKPIAEAGIYLDIPLEAYHEQLTVTPSISSSGLRQIDAESPLHYFDGSYLNSDREPPEYKAHFSVGTAVHMLLMGESGFKEKFAVRPKQFKDWRTADAQRWRDETFAAGLDILTADELEDIKGIAKSVAAEPLIAQGLFDGVPEATMVWHDPETGVMLKARPDQLQPGADLIADLKTCASADGMSCRRSIAEHGYHMQLGLAAEGYEILTGRPVPDDGCLLLFVEKKRPYAVNIKPVSAESIHYGRRQIRRAVRRFAKCLETGVWPGYDDSGITAYLPGWFEKQLTTDDEAGLLPDALKPTKMRKAA